MAKSHSFLWLIVVCVCVCVCVCVPHLLYPFISWCTLGLLSYLGAHISFKISVFIFFGYIIPRSRTAGSSGSSVFSFLKNPCAIFPQWLHQFTFLPTVYKGSLFSTSLPVFVRWYLIVVLICISLMIYDAEHTNLSSTEISSQFREAGAEVWLATKRSGIFSETSKPLI